MMSRATCRVKIKVSSTPHSRCICRSHSFEGRRVNGCVLNPVLPTARRGDAEGDVSLARSAGAARWLLPQLDRVTVFVWIGQVPGQILKPCFHQWWWALQCWVQVSGRMSSGAIGLTKRCDGGRCRREGWPFRFVAGTASRR